MLLTWRRFIRRPQNRSGDYPILNQYGMSDWKGPTGENLKRLKTGSSPLQRQLVENEYYSSKVPELKYEPEEQRQSQAQSRGSGNRPGSKPDADEPEPEGGPRTFAPGGVSYPPTKDPLKDDPMAQ